MRVASSEQFQAKPFVRGTKVRLVEDIVGYPSGSSGTIAVANGFAWTRYWVRFDDGNAVGHIDHSCLVNRRDYDKFLVARQHEQAKAAEEAELAAAAAAEAANTATEQTSASAGSSQVVVNGVVIPQRLLDMSAAARKRLGA